MNRYEEFANYHRGRDTTGHVFISECFLCGNLEWTATRTKEPIGYSVTPSEIPCGHCHEVRMRAPELVSWTLNVLSKFKQDLEEKP